MAGNENRLAVFGGLMGGGAFVTAACCFLPLMLMAAGVGSGVVALVGKASALALPLIGVSTLMLLAGWWFAFQRGAPRGVRIWLGAGTGFAVLAALIVLNEAAVVEFVMGRV